MRRAHPLASSKPKPKPKPKVVLLSILNPNPVAPCWQAFRQTEGGGIAAASEHRAGDAASGTFQQRCIQCHRVALDQLQRAHDDHDAGGRGGAWGGSCGGSFSITLLGNQCLGPFLPAATPAIRQHHPTPWTATRGHNDILRDPAHSPSRHAPYRLPTRALYLPGKRRRAGIPRAPCCRHRPSCRPAHSHERSAPIHHPYVGIHSCRRDTHTKGGGKVTCLLRSLYPERAPQRARLPPRHCAHAGRRHEREHLESVEMRRVTGGVVQGRGGSVQRMQPDVVYDSRSFYSPKFE